MLENKENTMRADITEQTWYALHEPLHAFLRKRLRNEETVEDVLQEIFLRIHTHAETLRDEEKLESWIYQIARHLVMDSYRRSKPVVSLEEVDQEALLEEMPEEDLQAELAPSVTAMVQARPEPYREALLLTEYQGLSQRELATRLGLSFSGAKSRVQRAREKLKQLLLECCHLEFDRRGRVMDYQPRCTCCTGGGCPTHAAAESGGSGCCVFSGDVASLEVKPCCS
jgi:RNA polymerase sigma-70 factor, ECF subfamily